MIDIDKLIQNVKEIPWNQKTNRTELWEELLVKSKEKNAIYSRDNFIFIGIDIDDNLQDLIDLELITEDAFNFKSIPDEVIDTYCKSLLIMYEMVDDINGLPVITTYVPNKIVPDDIKDILAASLIAMYRVRGFTTDSSSGDNNISII